MTNKKYSSLTKPSVTGALLGIASAGAGAYHGYCDAQGIPISKENLEFALTYGPAIVQGGLGTIVGRLYWLNELKEAEVIDAIEEEDNLVEKKKMVRNLDLITIAVVSAMGATSGIVGGLQTLIGYGMGYAAGKIVK